MSQTLRGRLKALAAPWLELLQVRLELLGVEAREELLRVVQALLWGLAALLLLGAGLVFAAILFTVLLWEGHRLMALAVVSSVFLTLGAVAAALAWRQAQAGPRLFAASLNELQRDLARLRQPPG